MGTWTHSDLLNRVQREDILTLVDSFSCRPVECDIYYILGEILSGRCATSTLDKIHILTIRCGGIEFTVAINHKDLYGHPEPGRRFKGVIWRRARSCIRSSQLSNRLSR